MRFETATPEETFDLGRRVGAVLKKGDVILFAGGLGAGKTLLTKGIVESFGYDTDDVTSPSFTLVNIYQTDSYDIYHIDLWRLESGGDIPMAIGLDEILENPKAIVLIEWAEKLKQFRNSGRTVRITIEGDGDEPRKIDISGLGEEI